MITSSTATKNEKDSELVEVTFVLTNGAAPQTPASVVGDFNDWQPGVHPLEETDGEYRAVLLLPRGRRYRFRYLADGRWFNDEAADAYEPNDHGGHDSVLDLTDAMN